MILFFLFRFAVHFLQSLLKANFSLKREGVFFGRSRGTCSCFISCAFRRGDCASVTRFASVFLQPSSAVIEKRANSRLRVKNSSPDCFFPSAPSGRVFILYRTYQKNTPSRKRGRGVFLVGPEGLEPPTKAL